MGARRTVLMGLLAALMLVATGCPRHRCDMPLVPREQLFAQHNDNAAKIPTLWAVADIQINLTLHGLPVSRRITDGRLYFRRRGADPLVPQDFMLRAKEVSTELFRLGIDGAAARFYWWADIPGRQPSAQWGDLAGGGDDALPINPTHILSLLGLLQWPEDLDAPTQVVAKVSADPCAYQMMVVSRRDRWGGWYLTREIQLDRHQDPPRPEQVRLYDRAGEVVMSAELSDYEPVAGAGDESAAAMIPTDISINWPKAEGVRGIRLRLSQPRVETDIDPAMLDRRYRVAIPSHIDDVRFIGAGGRSQRGRPQ